VTAQDLARQACIDCQCVGACYSTSELKLLCVDGRVWMLKWRI
jgi:hypothetical protein